MAKLSLKQGTTSKSVGIFIPDSSSITGGGLTGLVFNSASLTAYWYQPGVTAPAAITLATLAATTSSFSSGGFKELDATNCPGHYRLDIPNAVLTGATSAVIVLRGATNMQQTQLEIELTAVDNQDATAFGVSRLDAAVSSRMATYTQPTGFLAATFPTGTIANTTNITAGTITTTTNLTNAPTAGDFTATMKTSLNAATPASVTGAVGSVTGNVGGNVTGSVGSISGITFPTNFSALGITVGGKISGVVLTDTCTTNTDMRGTDSAALASVWTSTVAGRIDVATSTRMATFTLPTNFSSLSINGSGLVAITGDAATAGTRFLTMIELDSTVYRFTTNALEQAPSGGGGGGATAEDILKYDWSVITGEASNSLLNAGRMLLNKKAFSIDGTELNVYKEDGTTLAYEIPVTLTSSSASGIGATGSVNE